MMKLFPAVLSSAFLANTLFSLLLVNEGLAESPFMVPLDGKPGPYSEALWRKDWPGCEWENDMEWRTVDMFGVDSLYFETFHGGGDASWAPVRKCWADFGNIRVDGRK